MKMMQGADFLPCSNMSRTRLAPTPTNISTKSDPLMEKKGTSASPAIARARKVFRIAQKFDELLHFVLRFLDASDVAEGDLVLITREHARFAFAKIERAFSGHADLLAEEKIENEQKKGDRQKTDDGLR